jgi:hypothetical protein
MPRSRIRVGSNPTQRGAVPRRRASSIHPGDSSLPASRGRTFPRSAVMGMPSRVCLAQLFLGDL